MVFAASARQPRRTQRRRARTEKSCGPDARGSGVKSWRRCGGQPARASHIRKATGAIVQRSPGRARRTPLKPSRREGRATGITCRPPRARSFRTRGTSGASRRPAFPAPLLSRRAEEDSKARAKHAARTRRCVYRQKSVSCPGRAAARSDAAAEPGPMHRSDRARALQPAANEKRLQHSCDQGCGARFANARDTARQFRPSSGCCCSALSRMRCVLAENRESK